MKHLLIVLLFVCAAQTVFAQKSLSRKKNTLTPKAWVGIVSTFIIFPTSTVLLTKNFNNPYIMYGTLPVAGVGVTLLVSDLRSKKSYR